MPRVFFENSFERVAGAFKFVEICFSQLSGVKLFNLSFSKSEALLIRQSKYFNFALAILIIFFTSFVFT
tara:strand:+ start:1120 stop:1326 length:207 start_codon:yes stop_codon:yes gene_type:complete